MYRAAAVIKEICNRRTEDDGPSMTGKAARNAASVSRLSVIFSNCVTVETSLHTVRRGPAPPPEIRLYRLLGDNRVVSPPTVPVQNRRAVIPDGFPALQLPIDRRRGNADFSGNVRRAGVRLIQRGNLSPVRKGYIFVVSHHLSPRFHYLFRPDKDKK